LLSFASKFSNFTYKVDTGEVTSPENLAELVHEGAKWDSFDAPGIGISLSNNEMLRVGHFLRINVRLYLIGGFVTGKPYDPDFLAD
jgi:hypothetical protein